MTRRKGEITARMNERDYPHIVELPLPEGGFTWRTGLSVIGSTVSPALSLCSSQFPGGIAAC
jgi:hypothetical protein